MGFPIIIRMMFLNIITIIIIIIKEQECPVHFLDGAVTFSIILRHTMAYPLYPVVLSCIKQVMAGRLPWQKPLNPHYIYPHCWWNLHCWWINSNHLNIFKLCIYGCHDLQYLWLPRFASMGSLAASSACACDICQLAVDMPHTATNPGGFFCSYTVMELQWRQCNDGDNGMQTTIATTRGCFWK